MRKFLYFWLACILLMFVSGCKSKQTITETVHYVHDTAFSVRDSVVYKFITFNGTEREKTASWTVHDTINGTDTVYMWRYREVKAQAGENVKAQTNENKGRIVSDSAMTTATKRTGKAVKEKKGDRVWLPWLLVAVLVLVDILFFAIMKMKGNK